MLRCQPSPQSLPVGQGALRPLCHLRRPRREGTMAIRRLHLPGIAGCRPPRQRRLLVYDGRAARCGRIGRQGAVAGADRLLFHKGQLCRRPGTGRQGGHRPVGQSALQTPRDHNDPRSDHPPPLHRHDHHDHLLGRTRRAPVGFQQQRRPRSGLQVVHRPGAGTVRPGRLQIHRPGRVLLDPRDRRPAARHGVQLPPDPFGHPAPRDRRLPPPAQLHVQLDSVLRRPRP